MTNGLMTGGLRLMPYKCYLELFRIIKGRLDRELLRRFWHALTQIKQKMILLPHNGDLVSPLMRKTLVYAQLLIIN